MRSEKTGFGVQTHWGSLLLGDSVLKSKRQARAILRDHQPTQFCVLAELPANGYSTGLDVAVTSLECRIAQEVPVNLPAACIGCHVFNCLVSANGCVKGEPSNNARASHLVLIAVSINCTLTWSKMGYGRLQNDVWPVLQPACTAEQHTPPRTTPDTHTIYSYSQQYPAGLQGVKSILQVQGGTGGPPRMWQYLHGVAWLCAGQLRRLVFLTNGCNRGRCGRERESLKVPGGAGRRVSFRDCAAA